MQFKYAGIFIIILHTPDWSWAEVIPQHRGRNPILERLDSYEMRRKLARFTVSHSLEEASARIHSRTRLEERFLSIAVTPRVFDVVTNWEEAIRRQVEQQIVLTRRIERRSCLLPWRLTTWELKSPNHVLWTRSWVYIIFIILCHPVSVNEGREVQLQTKQCVEWNSFSFGESLYWTYRSNSTFLCDNHIDDEEASSENTRDPVHIILSTFNSQSWQDESKPRWV